MSKALYTTRYSDGALLSYNGSGWGTVGTYTPANWSSQRKDQVQGGCFVYRGRVYTRYMNTNDTGSVSNAYIDVFDGSDTTTLTSLEIDTSTGNEYRWGPVFYWQDRVCWLGGTSDSTQVNSINRNYLPILYQFYYDTGGTAHLTSRSLSELGAFDTINDSGTLTNANIQSNSNCEATTLRVEPFRDRLLVMPVGGVGTSGNMLYRTIVGSMSIVNGQVTYNPMDSVLSNAFGYWWSNSVSNQYLGLKGGVVSAIGWNGKMYKVNHLGKVVSFDPSTNTETSLFDITSYSGLQKSGSWTTDYQDTTDWTLTISTAPSDNYWSPFGLGGRMTVGGTSYYIVGVTDTQIRLADSSGNLVAPMASGTSFGSFAFGLDGRNTTDSTRQLRFAHMFVYNNKVHLLCMSGGGSTRSGNWNNAAFYPAWTLHTYDGTTTNHYTLRSHTSVPYIYGVSVALDDAAGILNVLYQDDAAAIIKHATVDLTAHTMTNVGTVCTIDQDTSDEFGLLLDRAAMYDPYDVTTIITSATNSPTAGTTTINYKLFSINSTPDTASILVEYNSGTGWNTATRKTSAGDGLTSLTASSSGTAHSFVHDVTTDLGSGYVGSLDYRISISSQSRN